MLNTLFNFIVWDVNSDIFTIPFINHPVHWYGIFWGIGLFLSYRILSKILKDDGKRPEFLDQLTLYIVIGTVLGARLGHVLFYDPAYYLSNPLKILAVYEGGLASHGGGIGILIALYLFARKQKINYWWIADRIALVVPVAGACIRLGNLMNSEIIGTPTDVPWAFVFTRVDQIPRHPAQLYEAIFCLLLFVVFYLSWNRGLFKNKNGNVFGVLLITLFSFRFVDEFFKVSQEAFEDSMLLNMGQLLSIPFVLIGLAIIMFNAFNTKSNRQPKISS